MSSGKGKGKRSSKGPAGNGGGGDQAAKRPRHGDASAPVLCMNKFLKGDEVVKGLASGISESKVSEFKDSASPASATLHTEPFTCCSLQNFVDDSEGAIAELVQELDSLQFREKNNDLYKFHQSADLNTMDTPMLKRYILKLSPIAIKISS